MIIYPQFYLYFILTNGLKDYQKNDSSKSINILQYADDLAIFAESEELLQTKLDTLQFTARRRNYVLTSVRVKLLYSMLIRAKHHLCIITVY